uniref:Uncharacterized protein n=1 Tax=Setaria digitata TaxID=48799 RepID=A0A915PTW3_9BILA
MCKTGTRRREHLESVSHRQRMARLEHLRRLREEEGLDPGRGEDLLRFNELYAKERETRSKKGRSRRKQSKRQDVKALKNVESMDAQSIRDVLRKRLKREESVRGHKRRDGTTYHRNDKDEHRSDKSSSVRGRRTYDDDRSRSIRRSQKVKKEFKKPSSIRVKLHELSMSPRTRRKKELGEKIEKFD